MAGSTSQGIATALEFAVGDGALGFWNAVSKHWSTTHHQHCWVHKTTNVLNKVPKSVQPRMKDLLHAIWMAETCKNAYQTFDLFREAVWCQAKYKTEMLAFYDFPAEHWTHVRTTNPIELMFATVRLKTNKTKNCGNRNP